MNDETVNHASADGDDDLHTLAGEYVLGSLAAGERRDVQRRLPQEPALRRAVHAWEARLWPLTALVEPVAPSSRLWPRISRSVDGLAQYVDSVAVAARGEGMRGRADAGVARSGAASQAGREALPGNGIFFWRGLSFAGLAAALLLAVALVLQKAEPPAVPRFMVVLVAPQSQAAGWVVQASTNQAVSLIPLAAVQVPRGKALEFWTKADDWAAPVSLGLVAGGETLHIPLDRLPPLQHNQLFELTLEPETGSPTGLPTGPIQFIGRAVKVL